MAWDPVWEQVFTSQAWGRYPGEDLIRFVARNFYAAPDRAAVRFLEVGCGTGTNLWFLAREGFAAHGIEGSATAAGIARTRLDAECPGWDGPQRRGGIEVGDMLALPWPDVQKIHAWWDLHGARFAGGTRYFLGHPVTAEHCVKVLREGFQRQRVAAAMHLALLRPGSVLFPTSAPAWRQQRWLRGSA